MKTVYLTSGPRGSGKSEFVKKVTALYPKIDLLSRDSILIELFGSTSLNPYEGGHHVAMKIFHKRINEFLSNDKGNRLILDCWNGFPHERVALVKKLRESGADRIVCWQFIVPIDTCVRWFFSKPDSKGQSESGIRRNYSLYYKKAENIETDGFDSVYCIDPRQLIIPFAIQS